MIGFLYFDPIQLTLVIFYTNQNTYQDMNSVNYCITTTPSKLCRFAIVCMVCCALVITGSVTAGELVEIYVNSAASNASDDNPGTAAEPLMTVNAAMRLVVERNRVGTPVRVIVAPGVYREELALFGDSSQTDAAILIEAAVPGEVIISGSDVWTAWEQTDDAAVYTHDWPFDWGLMPYPNGWEGSVVLEDIVRRREMIFIDGTPLQQVLDEESLVAGTFLVDEANDVVLIHLPDGVQMDADPLIEVATRDKALHIEQRDNVSIRGFVFQHASALIQTAGVSFNRMNNLTLEDNTIIWNNWQGVGFFQVQSITMRRNVVNYNGVAGVTSYQSGDLYSEDDESSYNNWRGVQGGFTGWAAAGQKHLHLHTGTFIRLRAVGNHTRAFWLDSDVHNITIESAYWCDNLTNGIFIESVSGPVNLRNSVICRNGDVGILTGNAERLTIESSVISGNAVSQISISGRAEGRTDINWMTGESHLLDAAAYWVIYNTAIIGMAEDHLLVSTTLPQTAWDRFIGTLVSDQNIWYNSTNELVFKPSGNARVTFAEWQQSTGQDAQSQFAAPPDWVNSMLQFRNR